MSALIFPFGTDQQPTLAEVGGKAQSLIATTKAGLPVPDGLALSVAFFAPWTEAIKATPEWQSLLDAPTKEACDRIKALAAKLTLTDAQTETLTAHLDAMGTEGPFAVRSSSPEEDLAGSSFAGMYETFLGTPRDQLEDVIANAYASMFDIRVMSYKVRQGIALEGTAISVIVQRQIASDVSGVGLFAQPDEQLLRRGGDRRQFRTWRSDRVGHRDAGSLCRGQGVDEDHRQADFRKGDSASSECRRRHRHSARLPIRKRRL